MKYLISSFSLLFVISCTKTPECKYEGGFVKEANAGCFVLDGSKLLFVESNTGLLSLPGGGKSAGEAPQCTAERETWEETGIEVKAGETLAVFDNEFQLFECQALDTHSLDGSKKPWRFEIAAIHWLDETQFDGKNWRFPNQIEFIKSKLKEKTKPK